MSSLAKRRGGDRVHTGTVVYVRLSQSCWVADCQGTPGSMFVTSLQARNLTSALWIHVLKVFQSLLNLGRLTHANNAYRGLIIGIIISDAHVLIFNIKYFS